MSMKISGYDSVNANIYQQAQKTSATEKTASGYDQTVYLKELNSRVNANVFAGVWDGQSQFGSAKGSTVMVHPDFLRQMHDDPELGAYYEEQINITAEEDAKFRQKIEAQGDEVLSMGTYIDENGMMSSCGQVRSTMSGPNDAKTDLKTDKKTKSAKELTEKMLEKLKEKREAEKAAEESAKKFDATTDKIDTLA